MFVTLYAYEDGKKETRRGRNRERERNLHKKNERDVGRAFVFM